MGRVGLLFSCSKLTFTAKVISNDLGGKFPSDFESIKKLKGIGDYTASAIASFAYDLPHAVLDGNVFRVFSRFLGIKTPIDSTEGKKEFAKITGEFLNIKQPGKYNQAIMDFGATQCVPANPNCEICPIQKHCFAFAENEISNLPVKAKKLKNELAILIFWFLNSKQELGLKKRREGYLANLYQFPMLESEAAIDDISDIKKSKKWRVFFEKNELNLVSKSTPFRQTLTHQFIIGTFWKIELQSAENPNFEFPVLGIAKHELSNFAFPKIIDLYLKDKTLTLNLI